MKSRKLQQTLMFMIFIFIFQSLHAQDKKDYFTIENYYKVKWGFADEFINLWKVNHYPLLKKAIDKGDIISVEAEKPKLHSGEDTRFDFKVTIVFKNEKLAFVNLLEGSVKVERIALCSSSVNVLIESKKQTQLEAIRTFVLAGIYAKAASTLRTS